ncbi:MAG: lysophospholipase [Bdellovibrionales bacterium]|nr:lysophospholipase [Ramlibacter sp.]
MTDSFLSTYTAGDGDNLAIQDWPLDEEDPALRGVVLFVHGLGEHAGRYDALARRLNKWGFAARGYDQYGHGESGGVRGVLPSETRLIDDLGDVLESTRARMDRNTPLVLLGHSMGGLVAARFVAMHAHMVEGLVLSSPAFDPWLGLGQKMLLAVLPKLVPNMCVGNGLDSNFLSHDRAVVDAYRADPLVHDRISGRLARYIATAGPQTVSRAPRWTTPTLLMYAGDDHLVNPAGSRAFAAAAPARYLKVRCFDGYYHEIFNESDPEPVFAELKAWLDARY